MKCKSCHKILKLYFYLIGYKQFCKPCALEFMTEIDDFKVIIEEKGGQKYGSSSGYREKRGDG